MTAYHSRTSTHIHYIFRILRISGFDENELTDYRGAVYSHIIYCMYEMLKAMENLEIEFDDKTLEVKKESDLQDFISNNNFIYLGKLSSNLRNSKKE